MNEYTSPCFNCGYYWEDLNEYGEPISLAYCHYDGPDEYAPCEWDSYDEYTNEARIEEEEAEFDAWLESVEESARPQNAHEYIEAWKQFRSRYE